MKTSKVTLTLDCAEKTVREKNSVFSALFAKNCMCVTPRAPTLR